MNVWWLAIRPKTLTAAIAPVAVGSALAVNDGVFQWLPALAALAGALLLQIGTNLSNDVLDYRRGADDEARLGPTRVTQAGLLSPRAVAIGAALCFALAALVGLYLVQVGGLPILVLGVAAIVSGVLYTAGPYPLAYLGLGDVFVMVFFGLAAVAGTYYVQALDVTVSVWAYGVAVGALSVAILTVNNLRDIDTDREAGKRTLAVRMGPDKTRRYFAALVMLAFVVPAFVVMLGPLGFANVLVLLAVPRASALQRQVTGGASGRDLNPVLGATAQLQIIHAALIVLGLLVGAALWAR